MEADGVAKEIRPGGGEVAVVGPILEVGPDGDRTLDAGGAAFLDPGGETSGFDGVFRVTMGVQQAHSPIRVGPAQRARPQPDLEKPALPCTLAACTTG